MFSYAVTTAKRPVSYVDSTLASLSHAGFTNPRIVSDGPYNAGCSVYGSIVSVGIVPTYRRALAVLLSAPTNFLIVFQDDITVSNGLYSWLINQNLQGDRIYSLYTSGSHDGADGWNEFDMVSTPENPYPWNKSIGSCGMVFPRKIAEQFISGKPPLHTNRLGAVIGGFCQKNDIPLMMHSPSLIQHIGEKSTLHGLPITTERKAKRFLESVE